MAKQLNLVIEASKLDDVEIELHGEYPDYCDSFIASADYEGRPLTDKELDILNEDSDLVYEFVIQKLI